MYQNIDGLRTHVDIHVDEHNNTKDSLPWRSLLHRPIHRRTGGFDWGL